MTLTTQEYERASLKILLDNYDSSEYDFSFFQNKILLHVNENNLELIDYILEYITNHNLSIPPDEYNKIIYKSIYEDRFDIFKSLIKHHPSPLLSQHSFVESCLYSERLDFIKHLVDEKVYIDFSDNMLQTAAEYGHLEIVQYFILECKQNVNYVLSMNYPGEEVMKWATQYRESKNLQEKLETTLKHDETVSKKVKI